MRVLLLCRTTSEAGAYARAAGLSKSDCMLVSPRTTRALEGLRLYEEDLIVEFPGFRQEPGAGEVIRILKMMIQRSKNAGPEWVESKP